MALKRIFAHLSIDEKSMRQFLFSTAVLGIALIIGLLTSADAGACASCGCTLSSDWSNLGFYSTTGIKLDVRWDYLNQDQLRSGTGTISPVAASKIVNNGSPQEVEKFTRNNYVTLGIDYSKSPDWGVNIQVPYINRAHSTLGTASDGSNPGPGGGQYDSHTSNLGDIRIIGRYQGLIPYCNVGFLFGVKLPTGDYTQTGTSTDPTAPGPVPIDRGLQPGTGTTDVILGAYYTHSINQNWDYFAQALFQKALYSKAGYMPGEGLNLNLGLRYAGFTFASPQVQFNFRHVLHDTGVNADSISTGGTLLYISPGVDVPVTTSLSVYGFVQVPLYQDVKGVQLAPRFTTSVGVRYAF